MESNFTSFSTSIPTASWAKAKILPTVKSVSTFSINRNRGDKKLSEKERVENGMTALKQEVSHLTGIYPDFYVMVEWEAIGEMVDAVGGVEFEVPSPRRRYPPAGWAGSGRHPSPALCCLPADWAPRAA